MNLKQGMEISYKIYTMGLYQVLEAENGLMLIWNKKTEVMLKLDSSYKVLKKHSLSYHCLFFL